MGDKQGSKECFAASVVQFGDKKSSDKKRLNN